MQYTVNNAVPNFGLTFDYNLKEALRDALIWCDLRCIGSIKGAVMYFLGLGVILLLLRYLEIGPVGLWSWSGDWYLFAAPFILAVIWWAWADASGYTKRRAMDRMDKRKDDRLAKNRDALGLGTKRK